MRTKSGNAVVCRKRINRAAIALTLVLACRLGAVRGQAAVSYVKFRNDTGQKIIVCGWNPAAPLVQKTQSLFPREEASIPIVRPGTKMFAFYDKRLKELGRLPIKCGGQDQSFSIQINAGKIAVVPR